MPSLRPELVEVVACSHSSHVMAAAPQFAAPFPPSAVPVVDDSYTAYLPSFLRPVGTLLDSLDAARDRLNLPEPGKYEDLGREVKREYLRVFYRAPNLARGEGEVASAAVVLTALLDPRIIISRQSHALMHTPGCWNAFSHALDQLHL